MQELIFIIILAVFIGGMLWSDRDSRCEWVEVCYDCGRMAWSERWEPLPHEKVTSCTPFTQFMVDSFKDKPMDFLTMFHSDLLISNEKINVDIAKADAQDSFNYALLHSPSESEEK